MIDLPTDVTPGARQVAQLTAWRTAQNYAIGPIGAALEDLQKLNDWSGGFLVADTVNFDWRTAPFKQYASFEDFYDQELAATRGAWDQLQKLYREIVAGTHQQAEDFLKQQAHAMQLAGDDGVRRLLSASESGKRGGKRKAFEK